MGGAESDASCTGAVGVSTVAWETSAGLLSSVFAVFFLFGLGAHFTILWATFFATSTTGRWLRDTLTVAFRCFVAALGFVLFAAALSAAAVFPFSAFQRLTWAAAIRFRAAKLLRLFGASSAPLLTAVVDLERPGAYVAQFCLDLGNSSVDPAPFHFENLPAP